MTRSYTVLQVLPALDGGGVERGTVEMVTALAVRGELAVVASAGGPMAREVEDAGGVHVELPLKTKNPLAILRNAGRLAEIIRRYNVDIVHARSRAPAWSAYLAARRTNCPFVTTFHNAYGASHPLKRLYNSVMAKGARVIAISDFVGDYATQTYGVPHAILRMVPRGVEIGRFDPAKVESARVDGLRRAWHLPEGAVVVMLPGRLTRWKGQLVLIEALAHLGRKDIVCLMVGGGSGDYRHEIEDAAVRHRLGGAVRIVEHCRDMPAALMLADVVVSASTRPEGFGRVIVEAQAMGRPVIATNHGGARESVIAGETGFLVPPGDSAALAQAITQVLNLTPDQRMALAVREVDHVRAHFTTRTMTDAVIAVYDELMQGKAA
ncbi:MAG TPA: glycosyltransferase family 4 protein [Alphaproteobacteria bacterium]|nr:glycosyltransferase family 4 protein [Alphaproteobacteria bacterium]